MMVKKTQMGWNLRDFDFSLFSWPVAAYRDFEFKKKGGEGSRAERERK